MNDGLIRRVPQAWIDRAMQIETAADALVTHACDAVQRAQEGSGRLYNANIVQIDAGVTAVLEAINLPEAPIAPVGDENDTPEARLDMVRVALRAIVDGGAAIPLAKAALDFCDRTQVEREAMRGEITEADHG